MTPSSIQNYLAKVQNILSSLKERRSEQYCRVVVTKAFYVKKSDVSKNGAHDKLSKFIDKEMKKSMEMGELAHTDFRIYNGR